MTDTASQPTARPLPPSRLKEFWSSFSENRGAVMGLFVFLAFLIVAAFAPVLAPYSPIEQYRDALLVPPAWQEGGSTRFLLGTDALGRDLLSRLIYGARFSFFIGVIVVTIATTLGVLLGVIAGFAPSLLNAMIAISIVLQPHFVRLTRAAVLTEKSKDYVTAARVAGGQRLRIMFRTVLPNCLAPIIVQAALSFSTAVLDTAALGFLGMGAQPPTPEWGTMLAESREFILRAWWVVTFPGLCILVTVLAINLMGDGLRDALDPKLKRS